MTGPAVEKWGCSFLRRTCHPRSRCRSSRLRPVGTLAHSDRPRSSVRCRHSMHRRILLRTGSRSGRSPRRPRYSTRPPSNTDWDTGSKALPRSMCRGSRHRRSIALPADNSRIRNWTARVGSSIHPRTASVVRDRIAVSGAAPDGGRHRWYRAPNYRSR